MLELNGPPDQVEAMMKEYMRRNTIIHVAEIVMFGLAISSAILTCGWSPRCNPNEAPAPPSAPLVP